MYLDPMTVRKIVEMPTDINSHERRVCKHLEVRSRRDAGSWMVLLERSPTSLAFISIAHVYYRWLGCHQKPYVGAVRNLTRL
jgi:hypothetical protein